MSEEHPVVEGSIIIGAGVVFRGEVIVPGLASVNGIFEGTLQAKDLVVGESGQVSGAISSETADVRGSVSENLVVKTKLTLRSSGSISGGMSYSKITVEEGGILTGKIEKIESANSTVESDPAPASNSTAASDDMAAQSPAAPEEHTMSPGEPKQSEHRHDDMPFMEIAQAGE